MTSVLRRSETRLAVNNSKNVSDAVDECMINTLNFVQYYFHIAHTMVL